MAKATLPVNFQDDIMNSSMGGKRRFKMINNSDGTVSFEDATTYDQVGSNFGAGQINATNQAVNESADKNKVIQDIDAIRNVTEDGYIAGALALKQVDDSLAKVKTYVGSDGKLHFVDASGADSVLNFNSMDALATFDFNSLTYTLDGITLGNDVHLSTYANNGYCIVEDVCFVKVSCYHTGNYSYADIFSGLPKASEDIYFVRNNVNNAYHDWKNSQSDGESLLMNTSDGKAMMISLLAMEL